VFARLYPHSDPHRGVHGHLDANLQPNVKFDPDPDSYIQPDF